MTSETERLPDDKSLQHYHLEFRSLKANQIHSLKKDSGINKSYISERLAHLPKVKSRPEFDRKMAAAFAMELEHETLQRNRSWLKKNCNISLPNVTTDFKKNLL